MTLVVFRSYVRPGCADEFNALADELMSIAESMPGFRSYKVFLSYTLQVAEPSRESRFTREDGAE